MTDRKSNIKRSNIIQLTLGIVAIVLVNMIASFLFTRVDLTAEKRYSLAPATKKLIRNLDDVVFFKVYLEGELPSGFRRLANETKEMLNEFRAYNKNIQYEFVNPSENPNAKERNDGYRLLVEQGLQPTDLRFTQKGKSSQLIIFPGAIVSYKGHDIPVQLLMTQMGQDKDKVLNNSIQSLEYNLASAILKLSQSVKPRIAFIEGEGELTKMETVDILNGLSEFYDIDHVTIDNKISSLSLRLKTDSTHDKLVNRYKAIVIAKPTKPFNEKDKYLIDQFIMRGGSVLWLIDPVFASMDSLQKFGTTMGITQDLNLEEMLFAYGVRPNTNLLLDLQALPIPVKSGQIGEQAQIKFFPWYFFPILTPLIHHSIMNGLNAIKSEFISSIDTVEGINVKKTILLTTSKYTRIVNAPVLIDLEILKTEPDERMFSNGPQPVAVLLEGIFTSDFQFRIPPELSDNKELGFLGKSEKPSKMVVITDGDIIKNQFDVSKGYPLPLGYDQFTRKSFGNKDFIMNIMNYLCDNSGLISVRSRELQMRSLDLTKLSNEKEFWQAFNMILPVAIILLFAFVKYRIRSRKYRVVKTKLAE